jgi:hypothetical protein
VPARASGEGNCHVDRRGLRVCAHPPASCKRCSAKAPAQWRASRGYRGSGAFQFHLERSGRLRVAPCVAVSSECVCQLLRNWDRGLSPYTQTVFGSQRFGTPHETVRLAA